MRRGVPSECTLRILAAAYYGLPTRSWAKTNLERTGYSSSIRSCIDRGALTADHQLTDYGLSLLMRKGMSNE